MAELRPQLSFDPSDMPILIVFKSTVLSSALMEATAIRDVCVRSVQWNFLISNGNLHQWVKSNYIQTQNKQSLINIYWSIHY